MLAMLIVPEMPADAEEDSCRVLAVDMTPTADLQMVVWLEDEAGSYVDTLYITRLTGTYGLGNRPGMMTFNSAWHWPYGRRTTTFPIWAHRHGMQWPQLVFQDQRDNNLSHALGQSSQELFYCRPLREGESSWDTQTCASTVYTDKGMFSATDTSMYPPRADLTYIEGTDSPDVLMFEELNPFDAISRPTPPGELPFRISWPLTDLLPHGNYVLWVEVSKEFEQNMFYDYPEPVGIPWSEYGIAYRGQPSVVYQVPFTLGASEDVAMSSEYAGYGDPDGLDGRVREPDDTITTGIDGQGASRLLLTVDGTDMYRVRVASQPAVDETMPGAASELQAVDVTSSSITASFVAPGDDGMESMVTGYEVRYLIGQAMTEDNFDAAAIAATSVRPDEPGTVQLFTIAELAPRTNYSIGIRAYDECLNYGPLTVLYVTTPERDIGTVDWCFVATAAYGSLMEHDVTTLRRFRDRFLRTHVTGELLVETYYTFGPALAKLIAPSDTMRRAARAGLAPLVEAVRELAPQQ